RIFESRDFRLDGVALEWIPGGGFLSVEAGERGGSDLWQVDVRSGERVRLVQGNALASSDTATAPAIEGVSWSADGNRLLLFTDAELVWREATRGTYLVYDRESGGVMPIASRPGGQMFAKFSPEGER